MTYKMRKTFVQIKQNVWIINTSKLIESMGKHTIVQIIRNVRISEGQVIRVLPYILQNAIVNIFTFSEFGWEHFPTRARDQYKEDWLSV